MGFVLRWPDEIPHSVSPHSMRPCWRADGTLVACPQPEGLAVQPLRGLEVQLVGDYDLVAGGTERCRYLCELGKRCLEVLDDLGGDYLGGRHIVRVFQ